VAWCEETIETTETTLSMLLWHQPLASIGGTLAVYDGGVDRDESR
jgi:hypothetical protein